MSAWCVGVVGSARSPPCTFGCSVTTRWPRIAGKPVSSATSVTGTPASASARAVPPLDTSSQPRSCSPRPGRRCRSCRRRTAAPSRHCPRSRSLAGWSSGRGARSTALMRSCSDSTVSSGRTATGLLGQDRPGVDLGRGDVHGAAGDLHAGGERVARRRARRGTTAAATGWVLRMRPGESGRTSAWPRIGHEPGHGDERRRRAASSASITSCGVGDAVEARRRSEVRSTSAAVTPALRPPRGPARPVGDHDARRADRRRGSLRGWCRCPRRARRVRGHE